MAIEIIHQPYCPHYFGGGVGLTLSPKEPQIQLSQELCSALSLLLSASYFCFQFLYRDRIRID